MCLQPFHWLSITEPFSDDEQCRKLCLTEGTVERYAEEKATNPFIAKDSRHNSTPWDGI